MISVIVPIYNVEAYLRRCLESIVNQTYRDLEIILVDDGSTDGSGLLCDEYARRDDRVKVIHKENGGAPSARNAGLRVATGDYILMPDGDDALHPQMVETLHRLICSGDYDFSMCYGETVYDTSRIAGKQAEEVEASGVVELTQDDCMRNLHDREHPNYGVVWTKLYKKELLGDLLFMDTPAEDTEFNNRVYLRMNKAVLLPRNLYYWVQRGTSITHQGVNARYVNEAHSLYICLTEVPQENQLYRAYCLKDLYRGLASQECWARKTPWHQLAVENGKTLRSKTLRELLLNPYVSLFDKGTLVLRNYVPMLYALFISLNEFRAKVKRLL